MPTQGLLPSLPVLWPLPARGAPHLASAAAPAPCLACDHFGRDPGAGIRAAPPGLGGPPGGAPGAAEMPGWRGEAGKRKVWPTPEHGPSWGDGAGHPAWVPGWASGLDWGSGWSLVTATASPGRQASPSFSAGGALWRSSGGHLHKGRRGGRAAKVSSGLCGLGTCTAYLDDQGTIKAPFWASLGVQWLTLCASNSGGTASIPGRGN